MHTPVSMMSTHFTFDLDLRVVHGMYPGKKLFLISTIHGDELKGIEVIRHILHSPLRLYFSVRLFHNDQGKC